MKTVFIVDDNDINLLSAQTALSEQFITYTLPSASEMFNLLKDIIPDLILLDILMPEINGFDAMKMLKEIPRYANIPVIFLTSRRDSVTEAMGFELGAVDLIMKPFSEPVLLNRIQTHLKIDDTIRQRTEKLQRLKNSLVSVLAEMLESRDKATGGHIDRTSAYLQLLVNAMIEQGVCLDEVSNWDIDLIVASARLHDVGKITISDLILNKPGPLSEEEFQTMKIHAAEGERIIEKIISQTGEEEFLLNAKLFAGYHHEQWDGAGYPHGLKGDNIPLQGRIMAIVDVYDALTSDRSYKKALGEEEALQIITKCKGSHFDPKITDVFLSIKDQFRQINEANN